MEEFQAKPFYYSSNSDQFGDSLGGQDQTFLPYWPNSTLSHLSIYAQGIPSDVYDESLLLSADDIITASNIASFDFSNQSASQFTSNITENLPEAFPNGGIENFTVQEAEVSQLPQQALGSDDSWRTFDMTDVAKEDQGYSQLKEPSPLDDNVPLHCNFPGCPEKQTFPTRSALKRHKEKHTRPYMCSDSSCNHKSFGDKGGLDRHRRELHSSEVYTCPVMSCPRNKKGFNRKYNLWEHQKRRHNIKLSSLLRSRPNTTEDQSESEEGTPTFRREIFGALNDAGDLEQSVVCKEGAVNGEQSLRSKLRYLQVLQAEIADDIKSLQRALTIIDEGSP